MKSHYLKLLDTANVVTLNSITHIYFRNGTASGGNDNSFNFYNNTTTLLLNINRQRTLIPLAPTATTNYGLLSLGSGAFDGTTAGFFTGSTNGTLIAGNLASGSTADLLNLQVGGVSKLVVTSAGNILPTNGVATLGDPSHRFTYIYGNELRGGASGNFGIGMISGGFSGYFRIYQNYDWNGQIGTWIFDNSGSSGNTATSGDGAFVAIAGHFKPASGTATYSALGVSNIINQTGGANGITRGIYINPLLTAAADFRALEIANNSGRGVYQSGANATNYFAGRVGVGANLPATTLEVNGTVGYTPSAVASVVAGTGITVTRGIMQVAGSGGAVIVTATPSITDGADGQIVIIIGTSDANTVTLQDELTLPGSGLKLAAGASIVLGLYDTMQLVYNVSLDKWMEISRSNN